MSRISIDFDNGTYIITNKLSYPEAINEQVSNAISAGMFEGFVPLSVFQKKNDFRIECRIKGYVSLTRYFGNSVTKEKFLVVVTRLAKIIKFCEANRLNLNNIHLHNDCIFINPRTNHLKCIYWPIVNNQVGNPPHFYLKQLPEQLNFYPYEERDYISVYKSFFNKLTPFSVNNFDIMVNSLARDNSKPAADSLNSESSGIESFEKKQTFQSSIEYDPFAYQDAEPEHETEQASFEPSTEMNMENSQPVSEESICEENDAPVEKTALLIRVKTNEIFVVDKNDYKIGKKEGVCDLVISGNGFISRFHAELISADGKYYLVDNNSTNRTFVNGKAIEGGIKTEITNGSKLHFANEEFLFELK